MKNHMWKVLGCAAAFSSTFSSAALGQGDVCGSAPVFIYVGSHAFDTSGLSTSGFELSQGCDLGAQNSFAADGFIRWYVPQSGNYQFDTNATPWDTQMAVYDGQDCSATCLGSDDDSGTGMASLLRIPGLAGGQQVLIQIGGATGQEGPGLLTITPYALPCTAGSEDAFEPNDACTTATTAIGPGTHAGLYASRTNRDFYSHCVPAGSNIQVELQFLHAFGDLDIRLWDMNSVECGSSNPAATPLEVSETPFDGEFLSWTNMSGVARTVVLEVFVASSSASDCNSYGLVISGDDCSTGEEFCPQDANSSGTPARLRGNWSSTPGVDLQLGVTGGPAGEFGYLVLGNQDASPGIALGNGQFCLVGTPGSVFYRYNVVGTEFNSLGQFGPTGVLQNLAGTSVSGFGFDVPSSVPGGPPILAGSTWHFQCWHRDTGAGPGQSDLSNGLSVTF